MVLVAFERPAVARTVEWVLQWAGFATTVTRNLAEAEAKLAAGGFAGFVADVALPGPPIYAALDRIASLRPAPVVVLVSAVYRKTSYKRRPTRLYGAQDYVELHHVGDQLPEKLWRHLGRTAADADREAQRRSWEEMSREGDRRFGNEAADRLAELIVADLLLYNGDAILAAATPEAAAAAVADDLAVARELHEQVCHAEGGAPEAGAVDRAFRSWMERMGKRGRT
jgi:DNA-binding response OmpR family regulator